MLLLNNCNTAHHSASMLLFYQFIKSVRLGSFYEPDFRLGSFCEPDFRLGSFHEPDFRLGSFHEPDFRRNSAKRATVARSSRSFFDTVHSTGTSL